MRLRLILLLAVTFHVCAAQMPKKWVDNQIPKIEDVDKIYQFYYLYSHKSYVQQSLYHSLKDRLQSFSDIKTTIAAYQVIGNYEKRKGNYVVARESLMAGVELLMNSNLEFKEKDIYLNGSVVLDIIDDLGQLYADLGNTKKAIELFEESITVKSDHYGESNGVTVQPSIRLARLLFQSGESERAIQLLEDSLNKLLYSNSYKVKPESLFSAYYFLADINNEVGNYSDAIRQSKIARRQKLTIGSGISMLNKSLSENLLSKIYINEGDYSNALKWLNEAKKSFTSVYPTTNNSYTTILSTESILSYDRGDYNQSLSALEKMMDLHINFIQNNFSNLSQIEKEQFYNQITEDLNLYFKLSINIYLKTDDTEILRSILNRRIVTKGFIINDQNKIKEAILRGGDETLIAELNNWQQAKEALAYFLFEDPSNPNVDSLNQVINSLERSLSAKTRILEKDKQIITERDILSRLKTGQAGVEIIRYTSDKNKMIHYAAILVQPGQENYSLVLNTIEEEDENQYLKYYRNAIRFEVKDENSYASLWQNIDEELVNVEHVLLSPDGILNQININTLPDNNGKYIIDKYQVVNMTNLKDLVNPAPEEFSSIAYLFGRPQYDYTKEMVSYLNSMEEQLLRSNLFMELENFNEQEFADLPGTESEVKSISEALNNHQWTSKNYIGAVATEKQVKSLDNPGILHIATHGFFLEATGRVNPMIKSGLVMAGVNNKGETIDDGVLTAYEATNLKLDNTWLVVLSACETGRGDVKNGEGVYGLQRALTVAGASNIMMTLWKVDDQATKELMVDFYNQLGNGTELETAFRKSQLKLREKYPSPKYWGSFVLVKAKG
jgi:CHAT domain-containing protein